MLREIFKDQRLQISNNGSRVWPVSFIYHHTIKHWTRANEMLGHRAGRKVGHRVGQGLTQVLYTPESVTGCTEDIYNKSGPIEYVS